MDNYEQKYKKALEAVKFLQEVNPSDEGIQNWVKDNFPELKESEDERMRKSIIYALRNGGFYSTDKTDEAIAWLEKQGEQHSPIDVNKMVDEFAHTEVEDYGFPSMIEVDAYRRGIEDALGK